MDLGLLESRVYELERLILGASAMPLQTSSVQVALNRVSLMFCHQSMLILTAIRLGIVLNKPVHLRCHVFSLVALRLRK